MTITSLDQRDNGNIPTIVLEQYTLNKTIKSENVLNEYNLKKVSRFALTQ